jgi:hypothetical protein
MGRGFMSLALDQATDDRGLLFLGQAADFLIDDRHDLAIRRIIERRRSHLSRQAGLPLAAPTSPRVRPCATGNP